jgi:gamma-glutamyltranspeptidase/glutathione hydrolase
MSRFDPRPGLPNSPAPGKRPLTNMCPTLITRDGVGVFAVGGAGGTRIPNSIYEVLLNYVGLGTSMDTALASQRIDANGTLELGFEKNRIEADEALLKKIGYKSRTFIAAFVSGATFDPRTGETRARAR